MYKLKYSKQAIKVLRKMPRNLSNKIRKKLQELAKAPQESQKTKQLKGLEASRLRVGDWRIIYTINNQCLEIWVVKIAPRGEVYKQ